MCIGSFAEERIINFVFGFLSVVGLSLLAFPKPLKPVYEGWLKIGHFIGKTVTSIILALAYYLVITPAGLLKDYLAEDHFL